MYYKENDCTVRIYQTNLTYDEARKMEINLIEELNPCCNLTKGENVQMGRKFLKS